MKSALCTGASNRPKTESMNGYQAATLPLSSAGVTAFEAGFGNLVRAQPHRDQSSFAPGEGDEAGGP